jgi:hypothetical protein
MILVRILAATFITYVVIALAISLTFGFLHVPFWITQVIVTTGGGVLAAMGLANRQRRNSSADDRA